MEGFGPGPVKIFYSGESPRVFALSQKSIVILKIKSNGRLGLKKRRLLSTSGTSIDSKPVVSDSDLVAFVLMYDSASMLQLMSVSTKSGKIIGQLPAPLAIPELAILEKAGRRLILYIAGLSTLKLVDASDPKQMQLVGSIPLPRNDQFSASPHSTFQFSDDGRYVFIGSGFTQYSAVDLDQMRVVGTLDNKYIVNRSAMHESSTGRFLLLLSSAPGTGGPGSIAAVDATDPSRLIVLSQAFFDDTFAANTGACAFSKVGNRAYVASPGTLTAFAFPSLVPQWQQIIGNIPFILGTSVVQVPISNRVLAVWFNGDFASIPAEP